MKDNQEMYHVCKNHLHAYVMAETNDGYLIDGIITGLDDTYVYFAIPLTENYTLEKKAQNQHEVRQYGYNHPGYGYGGYPGYHYPPRRFRRLILPLAALTAISLLPWY